MLHTHMGVNVTRMAPTATTSLEFGLAETVAEFRRLRGQTQAELANRSGIPMTTLQRRLNDGNFSISELGPVMRALEVDQRTFLIRWYELAGISDEDLGT